MESFMMEAQIINFEDENQQIEEIDERPWLNEGVWLKEEEVSEMVESLLKDDEVYFVDNSEENKTKILKVASDETQSVVHNTLDNQDVVKCVNVLEDENDNNNAVDIIILDEAENENVNRVTEFKDRWEAYPMGSQFPMAPENVNHSEYNWWYEDQEMWYSYPTVDFRCNYGMGNLMDNKDT